ncbi:TPA: hypothetical protein ENS27_08905 [bacterium]|nr:hypothetical protein [bacterium]
MNNTFLISKLDYIDADVAYLLGLITARGKISESGGIRQVSIEFPYHLLEVQGINKKFDTSISIRLGLQTIRERVLELTNADVEIINRETEIVMTLRFIRNTMVWRNIQMHLNGKTSYEYFLVPEIMFLKDVPTDWKREYIKGFVDVAGNIRLSNRYTDGTNRVRIDILNYPNNWTMPIQLCALLEEHLGVPIQLITWGHPNMGRNFREHQINIFAVPFAKIGFTFDHKQAILDELIEHDKDLSPNKKYYPCTGKKVIRRQKKRSEKENDDRLDERIRGCHFNSYWQICKKLGCLRTPKTLNHLIKNIDEKDIEKEEVGDEV